LRRTSRSRADGQELPRWARVTDRRRRHIARVAALLDQWAEAMAVSDRERRRWLRAAWLHDALKDAPLDAQRRLARGAWDAPSLWHGPAAAARAARAGERDRGVLAAVRYHSVGYARWDAAGRMLYLADYLDPGRRHHDDRLAGYAARVPEDPDRLLRAVASERIARGVAKGWPLLAETVTFWNALA
jgi:HD superfamily phosphohydrolase YqeK